MARATTTAAPALPWWATTGDETCAYCLQCYHYHLEIRCTNCDEPLCPSCATHLSIEIVALHCPECATGNCEEA